MVFTVASCSFWTIGAGVSLGKKKALQFDASKSVNPCSCAEARFGRLGEVAAAVGEGAQVVAMLHAFLAVAPGKAYVEQTSSSL